MQLIRAIYLQLLLAMITCKNSSIPEKIRAAPGDTACASEIARAEADISHHKLVYCYYTGNLLLTEMLAKKEMINLLAQAGIGFQNEASPCVIQENRNYHCYCETMQQEIAGRFGSGFTESLAWAADSLYIMAHLSDTFYESSQALTWDRPALLAGEAPDEPARHAGLQRIFDSMAIYPPGYRRRSGGNSMAQMQLSVIIDENGNATVTGAEFVFWDSTTGDEDYNRKHWPYLRRVATAVIQNGTWQPALIRNMAVKSQNTVTLLLQ